ncbi:MAG: hypothetical protein ACLFUZ_03890, partial [Candidatus Micrarchaeia archaeon]
MSPPKNSSRKTKKTESGPGAKRKEFPDAGKGGHSLARRKPPGSFNPPNHKLSTKAKIAMGGIAAATALSFSPAADAKNAPSILSKAFEDQPAEAAEPPVWQAIPPDSYEIPEKGKSIVSILKDLKEKTKKFMVEENHFRIKRVGRTIDITHNPEDKEFYFEIHEMTPLSPAGGTTSSFFYGYRYLDLGSFEFRADERKNEFVLYGIDAENSRMLEIHVPYSLRIPDDLTLYTVEDDADEKLIEFIFQALANLPEVYSEKEDWKSRKVAHAVDIGEKMLEEHVSGLDFGGTVSSSGNFEKALDSAIDKFVVAYADTIQKMFDSISADMETLSPKKAEELADFVIPRMSAILLRPHAANLGPSI